MKIAVLGASCTQFGELWDKSLRDLLAESQLKALIDAQLKSSDIGAIYTGTMCAGMVAGQLHVGAMAADIIHSHSPSMTVEGACASGGLALRAGIAAIESGFAEVVLVNGVEKMTDVPAHYITQVLMGAADEEREHFIGATFPGLNALITRAYMHTFGLTRQQLAAVSVKNHQHATHNPLAQFPKTITIEDVINAPMVADPLTVLDCAPVSDGAASLILSSQDFAKYYMRKNPDKKIVYIIGSGQGSDSIALASREKLIEFKANKIAAYQAYKLAKVECDQVNIVELHDAFSINEIVALEDLGFFPQGSAGLATEQGVTSMAGRLPVNPSGGLKAKGHPVGASGVAQAYEMVMQLRGTAGKRQIKDAQIGLTHSMGGCGITVVVHIFQKG
jgi:acetyl-CoA C-acetyltransferase